MEKLRFKNKTITVNNAPLNVELAETNEELKQGQRGKSEPSNMLLKFPEQGKEKSITMAGVGFPLKLAFIKKGVVTNVVKRNDPNSEKLTTYNTDAVLELPIYAKIKTGDIIKYKQGGAWTRTEGQSKTGGLNQKGRDSYNRENPGSNLKPPQPEGGSRKKSYCARSAGQMKMFPKAAKNPNSRLRLARKKWKCEDGCKFEDGGVINNKLNQGDTTMEFVLSKTNTVRDHTLDGYSTSSGKLVENKNKSVQGYLRKISNTKGLAQLGENLYTALPIKSKDMIDGIADLLRKVKDKSNRLSISKDVINDFEKQNIDYNKNTFLKSIKLEKGGINIDPKNKGKFTETKKRTGKSTEELTHSKNPLTKKRAVFAQNASKWNKHELGGNILSKLKKGGMYLLDENGEVQTELQGGERIFSRKHTKKLIDKTLLAKTPKDLEKIGKELIKIIDIHNKQNPQYVEE
jgi:uncharacterized membrane protein (UPF0127 family)